jgi:hypothetical protein
LWVKRPGDEFRMVTGIALHGDRLYLGRLNAPEICALHFSCEATDARRPEGFYALTW